MSLRILLFSAVACWCGGTSLVAADDASLGKDLKATIALQGMPCSQLRATQVPVFPARASA